MAIIFIFRYLVSTPGNGIACSTHSFFTSRDTTFSYLAKQWKKKKTKVSLAINKLSIMLTNFASKSFSAKKLSLSLSLSSLASRVYYIKMLVDVFKFDQEQKDSFQQPFRKSIFMISNLTQSRKIKDYDKIKYLV